MVLGHNCAPHFDTQVANLSRQRVIAAHLSPLCLSACYACMQDYTPYQLRTSARATCITASVYCRRWVDAGKFLTGFSAIGSVAVPAILFHAQVQNPDRSCQAQTSYCAEVTHCRDLFDHTFTSQLAYVCMSCDNYRIAAVYIYFVLLQKITAGALWTELAAVAVLGATVFAFDFFSSSDSGYYTY